MESAGGRTLDEMLDIELPEDVWDGREYTNIYCAILFADLEGSVQISRIASPADYDQLIDEFQSAMLRAIEELRKTLDLPRLDISLAGDQLAVFFIDEKAVQFNWLLDREPRLQGAERKRVVQAYARSNADLTLAALKAAVYLKSSWLANPLNIERISQHREPVGLALGVHADKVFLRNRADGKRRVEGFTVNLAKRVESFSRHGKYSRIMFSQNAANTIRGMVLKHTQLRQRIFFHRHVLDSDQLKGLGRTEIFELKFFHLIGIPEASERMIELYDKILSHDPTYIWAYYQLSAHYARKKDYVHLERLARRAFLIYPQDEKILFDLGLYYLHNDMLGQATRYFQQALEINPDLDLAHEYLAYVYDIRHDFAAAADNARSALLLSPGSPTSQMNLGLALCDLQEYDEAAHHLSNAFDLYPDYLTDRGKYTTIFEHLEKMAAAGRISRRLLEQLRQYAPEFAASMPPQACAEEESQAQTQ